jgi:hypothetical protein
MCEELKRYATRIFNEADNYQSLWPFALNFAPRAVSLPPPAGFEWHCPHPKPVCCAKAGVAAAGRGTIVSAAAPASKIAAPAVPARTARTKVEAFETSAMDRVPHLCFLAAQLRGYCTTKADSAQLEISAGFVKSVDADQE